MARKLREGELPQVIKSNPKALVVVDFGQVTCPPCVALKPWFDELPARYPTCKFYTIECSECADDARARKIQSTPTILFFKNQQEVQRIIGGYKDQIIAALEKFKPPAPFDGVGRSLTATPSAPGPSPPPPTESTPARRPPPPGVEAFLAQIEERRHAAAAAPPVANPSPRAPPPSANKTIGIPGGQHSIPSPPAPVVPDLGSPAALALKAELSEVGFTEEEIDAAIRATNIGPVEDCVDYIGKLQSGEVTAPPPVTSPPPPTPSSPPQAVAGETVGPQRALSPSETAVRDQLIEIGFSEDDINRAISAVGGEVLDRVIDAIERLHRGESLEAIHAAQPGRLTPEELERRAAAMRERIAQNKVEAERAKPKVDAESELKRRQDVLNALEAKRKHDESQRELAKHLAAKEKRDDLLERDRIRAKIAQQRASGQKSAAAPPPPVSASQPKPRPAAGPGALRLNVPGLSPSPVLSFPSEALLGDVDREFRQKYPQFANARIQYNVTLPPAVLNAGDMKRTLADLGLSGRAVLNVTVQS
jgi:thioredoxin 1